MLSSEISRYRGHEHTYDCLLGSYDVYVRRNLLTF
jgi:hypothetical protein